MLEGIVDINREEAIRFQLETAIQLWFGDGDPISTHTLACSALKIAHDVFEKTAGKKAMLFQVPKERIASITDAQNFFKHARDDHDATLEFNTARIAWHIYDAAHTYKELYGHLTVLMAAFILRFLILHPEIGSAKLPTGLPEGCDETALAKASNDEFLALVIPALS
jgi:hypothetical protein